MGRDHECVRMKGVPPAYIREWLKGHLWPQSIRQNCEIYIWRCGSHGTDLAKLMMTPLKRRGPTEGIISSISQLKEAPASKRERKDVATEIKGAAEMAALY
jgi:hypothetical protein